MAGWDFTFCFGDLHTFESWISDLLICTFTNLGFPTPAAYAAYTGRGYSSYPGFGLASGIAGYPAGKFTVARPNHSISRLSKLLLN